LRKAANKVVDAARGMLKDANYVCGLPDTDRRKGSGNYLADALHEYDAALKGEGE